MLDSLRRHKNNPQCLLYHQSVYDSQVQEDRLRRKTSTTRYERVRNNLFGFGYQVAYRSLNRLLFDTKRDAVTLYVSHGNSAQRVYDRVGFVGLCGKEQPADVEDSIELGFVGTARGIW